MSKDMEKKEKHKSLRRTTSVTSKDRVRSALKTLTCSPPQPALPLSPLSPRKETSTPRKEGLMSPRKEGLMSPRLLHKAASALGFKRSASKKVPPPFPPSLPE